MTSTVINLSKAKIKEAELTPSTTLWTVTGSTKADIIKVVDGVSAKKISLSGGNDQIHLPGDHDEYIIAYNSSKTLTVTQIDNPDIYLKITVDSSVDTLYFADGYANYNLKGSTINFGNLKLVKGDSFGFSEDIESDTDFEFNDSFELNGDDKISLTARNGDGISKDVVTTETISIDGIGDESNAVDLTTVDISDGSYIIKDDVTKSNNVNIEGFGKDDKIIFTNVPMSYQTKDNIDVFSPEGSGNTSITLDIDGNSNTINLIGVHNPKTLGPVDFDTFNSLSVGDISFK